MTLLYDIIFLTHGGIPQYKVDPCLDLDSALMDASTSPLANWLYNSNAYTYTPISHEPWTPLSASSSLSSSQSSMSSLKSYIAKSERRKSAPASEESSKSHQTRPRLIRAPETSNNCPSFPPVTHMRLRPTPPPSASPTPAPLVLYMQEPVSAAQWVDAFFHDFVANDTSHSLEIKSMIASIWATT